MSVYEDIKAGLEQAIKYERQGFGEQKGWICPVCGRGVAPWESSCPCQNDWKITYGTSIGVNCEPDEDTRKWINEQRNKFEKILLHKDGSIE